MKYYNEEDLYPEVIQELPERKLCTDEEEESEDPESHTDEYKDRIDIAYANGYKHGKLVGFNKGFHAALKEIEGKS